MNADTPIKDTSLSSQKDTKEAVSEELTKALNTIVKDKELAFTIKKTERIISAIYIVSDFFDDREPIKWRIRDKALEALEAVLMLGCGAKDIAALGDNLREIAGELTSLLEVAKASALASSMNATVIQRELGMVLERLRAMEERGAREASVFSSDYFTPAGESALGGTGNEKKMALRKAESERPAAAGVPGASARKYVEKEGRRGTIIRLTREKGEVGVKDVAAEITDVSEKTLQRELLSLVAEGVLKKEGERRWSRYSLT